MTHDLYSPRNPLDVIDELITERDLFLADRDRYIRAFNSLEKSVTKHVEGCIDCEPLERAHRTVMRMLAERTI